MSQQGQPRLLPVASPSDSPQPAVPWTSHPSHPGTGVHGLFFPSGWLGVSGGAAWQELPGPASFCAVHDGANLQAALEDRSREMHFKCHALDGFDAL